MLSIAAEHKGQVEIGRQIDLKENLVVKLFLVGYPTTLKLAGIQRTMEECE